MTWHVSQQTMRTYVDGRIAETDAWSVEAHLTSCEHCRATLAAVADDDAQLVATVEDAWAAVAGNLTTPGRVQRGTRFRELAVLLTAGPAARWAWLAATVVVLAFAAGLDVVAPLAMADDLPLLGLVAPVVPILGVAASYGTGLDDAHEIITSTPGGGLRLLLVRSVAVLAVTAPMGLVAGAVTGYGSPVPWLLASLALTVLTLALGSVTGIGRAAVLVGGGWMVVVVGGATLDSAPSTPPVLLTVDFTPAWLAVTAVAGLVVAGRRAAFDVLPLPTRPRMEN